MTHIDFGVRASSLRAQAVTDLLGVEPTVSFSDGDEYISKQKTDRGIESVTRVRPHGVWHYSTEGLLAGASLDEHALLLLNALEPSSNAIRGLCESSEYFVIVSIWYVGSAGFGMRSDLVRRLAMICKTVSVTCWELNENDLLD